MELALVVALVIVALAFAYINGFHDAANSIATVVSTHVLSPGQAVAWAAFFNLIAVFGAGTAVAMTIGSGMIRLEVVTLAVIFSGLFGAIAWDLLTWYLGLPTSSSHALIGGYAGAAVAKAGLAAVVPSGWIAPAAFVVVSPLIGLMAGLLLMLAIYWSCRRAAPDRANRWFRKPQLVSSALFAWNHGANDAQKSMGIIAGVLFTVPAYRAAVVDADGGMFIPFWVALAAHAAIAAGTLAGGWRIIKTMGSRLTRLEPPHGFAAETGAAAAVFTATALGIPVSTTHTITGAIVGVGAVRRASAVRWAVAGRIVWAWVLTIPAAALLGMAMQWSLGLFGIR